MSLGPPRVASSALAIRSRQAALNWRGNRDGLDRHGSHGLARLGDVGNERARELELPDDVTEVILLAENDGGPNEKALNEIVPALAASGIKALIARPPPGLKDFNDSVNGKSGHLPEAGRIVVKKAIEAAGTVEVRMEWKTKTEE